MATVLNIAELTGRLGRLIHRTAENCGHEDVIEKGDFRIDLSARCATIRGQRLLLSAEEFDLLVFLARHPQRIVTPRTTLTTRWGDHEVREADFLRVLSGLRQKLAAVEGGANYIRIEPWVFCRFEPV